MRRVFRSAEHNETFLRDGAVLAQLLTEEEAHALQRFYWNEAPSSGPGFHATMFSHDAEYRARVDEKIKEYLSHRLAMFLDDYRCVVGNFVVKEHSRPETEVSLHQDWTFVDERLMRSVNVWCPLIDTDASNGGQSIFKGSHRIVDVLRGPYFPNPFVTHAATIAEKYLMDVPLRAGQAIIYDHALVHATHQTRAGRRASRRTWCWFPERRSCFTAISIRTPHARGRNCSPSMTGFSFTTRLAIGQAAAFLVMSTTPFRPSRSTSWR